MHQESSRNGHDGLAASAIRSPLFDLSSIDLSARLHGRDEIARLNPHRGHMALVDHIIWMADDLSRGVGLLHLRPTDFWFEGHFPGNPMMPGVLIVEAAGQLGHFINIRRAGTLRKVLFTRILEVSFRTPARPGDDLLLLCNEIKNSRRCFVSDIQAMVGDTVVMAGRISGAVV